MLTALTIFECSFNRFLFLTCSLIIVPLGLTSCKSRRALISLQIEQSLHALHNALDFDALLVKLLPEGRNVLVCARLRSVLLNGVDLGVHVKREHVLVAVELFSHFLVEAVQVVDDKTELGAVDVGLFLALDAPEGSPHDRDHHVQDDQERDQGADEENEPEDEHIIRVFREVVTGNLKISQSQPVRVD